MSLISSIFKGVVSAGKAIISSPVAKAIAPVLGGPVGIVLGAASTAYGAYQALKTPGAPPAAPMPSAPSYPSLPPISQPISKGVISMAAQPGIGYAGALTALPAVGRAAVRYGVAGAKRVYQSAANYCKKHPGWCQTIGGIAAVEALIQGGQLPVTSRRRGRGITATELRNFKRVARFTSKYCAPVRKAMSSKALRGGKSCR